MRTFTSVQSATEVLLDFQLHVEASDASTTWIFTNRDITKYPSISWEGPFQGGFGVPSSYKITLQSSIGFLRANYVNLYKGTVYPKVFVNSDNFVPHRGIITSINRNADNTNEMEFTVLDVFQDANPKVPNAAITDSYSIVHPEVYGSDMGYSLYYGKHTRPFYMTPVDCNISILLGPKNVSSENHVTSLFYTPAAATVSSLSKFLIYDRPWDQQSGGTNIAAAVNSTYSGLFCGDYGGVNASRFVYFSGKETNQFVYCGDNRGTPLTATNSGQTGDPGILYNKGYAKVIARNALLTNSQQAVYFGFEIIKNPDFQGELLEVPFVKISNAFVGFSSWPDYSNSTFSVLNGSQRVAGLIVGDPGDYVDMRYLNNDNFSPGLVNASRFYEDASNFIGISRVNCGGPTTLVGSVTITVSFICIGHFDTQKYKNYSIYGTPVNCADIAISENPNGIIKDIIINDAGLNLVLNQNSTTQLGVNSFKFQSLFAEREKLSDVLNDFGRTTGTYYWIGDSGYLNTRTYQESATITASINATLTTSDIIPGSMRIKDSPLGVTLYESKKYSRIQLDYDYNFTTGKYDKFMVADRNTSGPCSSLYAAGIRNEITIQSKHIKETATASLWAVNMIRKHAIDAALVEFQVPAQFMGIEFADVLQINHPSLLVTPSIFQVTKVQPDYQNGVVELTANEVVNL